MTTVITPPTRYITNDPAIYTVFLAGAIDMGAAVDWQAEVITRLSEYGDNLILFNPRRPGNRWPEDYLDEQIEWELELLDFADTVFMWLPKDSKAPVSMFEAGLYWKSGKLCIGADPGFYRRRNLELTGKYYGVCVYPSLDETLRALTSVIAGSVSL